jgi:nicotinamide riboside kinase
MHALFRAKLQALGLKVVAIRGDRNERFARAVQAIEALMSEST